MTRSRHIYFKAINQLENMGLLRCYTVFLMQNMTWQASTIQFLPPDKFRTIKASQPKLHSNHWQNYKSSKDINMNLLILRTWCFGFDVKWHLMLQKKRQMLERIMLSSKNLEVNRSSYKFLHRYEFVCFLADLIWLNYWKTSNIPPCLPAKDSW